MPTETPEKLILEIEIPGINTEGMQGEIDEYELDLWDLLCERIETEAALGIGIRESDNARTIAAHDGLIRGARLEAKNA